MEINVAYLFTAPQSDIEQKSFVDVQGADLTQDPDDLFIVHTRACVVCGATFQTCGKGNRCSGCLLKSHPESTSIPTEAHITCRVCDKPATVPLDHPALLCPLCLMDLDVTRARVKEWLENALARLDQAKATWEATLHASTARDRWSKVVEAMIAVSEKRIDQARFDRDWQRGLATGGDFAALLRAYETYAAECDQISAELQKLNIAQREINHAWLAEEL